MKKRGNRQVALKISLLSALSILIVFALVFGIGLLNSHGFQKKAIQQGKDSLKEHFAQRGENVTEFISPDYSLGMIEIGIITDTSSYYAVLKITNSWWVTSSILNVVMTPKVEIIRVEQDHRVREKNSM